MLLAHQLHPLLAIFIVAITGIVSVVIILHAIASVNFASAYQHELSYEGTEVTP